MEQVPPYYYLPTGLVEQLDIVQYPMNDYHMVYEHLHSHKVSRVDRNIAIEHWISRSPLYSLPVETSPLEGLHNIRIDPSDYPRLAPSLQPQMLTDSLVKGQVYEYASADNFAQTTC